MSGVSYFAYWLSNYALDMAKYLCPVAIFSVLMIYAFDLSMFTDEGDVMAALCLLFFLYGFSIIPFTYLFGFLFKSHGNA